jgi:hypothetical protein
MELTRTSRKNKYEANRSLNSGYFILLIKSLKVSLFLFISSLSLLFLPFSLLSGH